MSIAFLFYARPAIIYLTLGPAYALATLHKPAPTSRSHVARFRTQNPAVGGIGARCDSGNMGTLISFQLGLSDAELLENEFYPELTASDLIWLPNYHIYLRLMADGVKSRPFSAVTLPR